MGKLHKIKKAILKNPDKWNSAIFAGKNSYNQWVPGYSWIGNSYRNFIKKILRDCRSTDIRVDRNDG